MSELQEAYDLRAVTAKNIATLRTSHKLTQLELGDALSYSDKAISKWERGEAVPDAFVLLMLSRYFEVSVDWLLTPHGEEPPPVGSGSRARLHRAIALLSFFAVFAAASVAFVTLAMLGTVLWQLFLYALPVSLTVLLVFNSLWGVRRRNFLIVAALLATLVLAVYVALLPLRPWFLFLLIPPAELCVLLSYNIVHSLARKGERDSR